MKKVVIFSLLWLLSAILGHTSFALPPHLVGVQNKELSMVRVLKKSQGKTTEKVFDLQESASEFTKYADIIHGRTKTVISTAVIGETKGDISAASKFIKHLISDTDLTSNDVIWVISEQQGNFKQYSFIPEDVTVVAVGSFDSLMLYKPLKDIFGNMDIHVAYPTFHYFSDDMIKFLNEDINEEFAAKTILVTEYDYQDSLDKYKNFNILKTGFGKDALGVFFESDHVDYQSKKYLAGNLNFLLNEKDLNNQGFYFGYFNRHDWSYSFNANRNKSINAKLVFAVVCILLDKGQGKDTNLIINMAESEVEQLKRLLTEFKIDDLSVGYLELTENISSADINEFYKNKNNVNIFNPFPLDHKDMKKLICESNAFIGITGDQSFIESLSLGKMVFYQVMNWKTDFFKNYTEFFKQFSYQEAYSFYDSMLNKPDGVELINSVVKTMSENKELIFTRTIEVKDYIKNNYNLRKNLIPLIDEKR